MSVYHQSKSRVIQIIFVVIFAIITGQLVNLQIFSSKYRIMADNNAIYRKVIYPDRGIIFDRKQRAILENTIMYDLMVIPSDAKATDKIELCKLLNIDTAEYRKRIVTAIIKNTSVKSSVFEPLLSPELYAKLNENIYKFPGFILQERSIRNYPYNTAAAILGYLGEVDTAFLRKYRGEGYEMGDYTGLNGLERTYEKVLMGQRGIKRFIRDNRGRLQGSFEKGAFDTTAIAGRNLYTSIDIEVQQLAEKLLQNKIGSAVAINPKTGSVIAMATSPSYNPNSLIGSSRRRNFGKFLLDTARPLLNRAIKGQYPPGSTFKPLGGLVALDEGLITPTYGFNCFGAYVNCGKPVRCTHAGGGHASDLRRAIAYSCNSYFVHVFRMAVDNPAYANPQQGYLKWKEYMNTFGLGVPLGIDLPGEAKASIPDTSRYNKDFGGFARWKSCNILTLGIGQDRMTATPLQLANLMCIIANRGYYYTPHIVDSIENETIDDTAYLAKYRLKHEVTHVADSTYKIIQDGMEDVTIYGTASFLKVPGHKYCAKTGTAQNPHGKNHAVFTAFAPKDNPTIAISVVVENSGYGGTWAGPVATLLMEKYLNDTLTTASAKRAEEFSTIDLIPAAIKKWYYRKDSIRAVKEREKEKEMEQRHDIETDTTNNIKTTFDPEAEPNRKSDDDKRENNMIKQTPMLNNTNDKKKKKDSTLP
ncbi:MAG: penicillin-binding protein 2 [Chitinophagaceae bacterium]|nr:penicillin-binding protein 2 [Chitinophagaceae bacterium]MCW5906103.1 penicillin-binding protein 2 [Chitinophagaceae bacterium]